MMTQNLEKNASPLHSPSNTIVVENQPIILIIATVINEELTLTVNGLSLSQGGTIKDLINDPGIPGVTVVVTSNDGKVTIGPDRIEQDPEHHIWQLSDNGSGVYGATAWFAIGAQESFTVEVNGRRHDPTVVITPTGPGDVALDVSLPERTIA